MRARAEELGGTFAIDNTDPGVCVRVGLPLDGHIQ
jgi:signal transduction histidine kinase